MFSGHFQEDKKESHITGEKKGHQVISVYKRERDTFSHTFPGPKEMSCCQEFPTWKLWQVHRSGILKGPIQLFYLHLDYKEIDSIFPLDSLIFRDARVSWSVKGPFFERDCGLLSVPISHTQQNISLQIKTYFFEVLPG